VRVGERVLRPAEDPAAMRVVVVMSVSVRVVVSTATAVDVALVPVGVVRVPVVRSHRPAPFPTG
jgi:hypothetical protein